MESGWKKASKQKNKRKNRKNREIMKKSNIPQDIIDEILIRLPLKSVVQFKVVSKLWNSTISNPTFHRIHDPVTRIFTVVETNPLLFQSVDEKGSIKKFQAPSWCKVERKEHRMVTSNSCNGMLLLCLDTRIFVLNPTTHYIDLVLTLDDCGQIFDFDSIEMGFFYDESIDDYKAFIFHIKGATIFVASLKEKVWTTLRRPIGFSYMSPGPLVNDRLHATTTSVFDNFGVGNVIVYFNPIKSIFEHVPGPQPKSGVRYDILSLGVLEGCLCIARKIEFTRDIEVLKMKEYGIADSWTTLFVLPDLNLSNFYGFKLFLETNNGYIFISYQQVIWRYNLANKTLIKFMNYNPMVVPVNFVESICSPNGSSVTSKYMRNDGGRIGSMVSNCEVQGNTSVAAVEEETAMLVLTAVE